MRKALRTEQHPNNELTRLLQFSGWNQGTHLHSIHNGDLEIAVRVSQASLPLIFNTSNEVICCFIQRYWLNVPCASLCLSRQLCTEGPRCRRLQNILISAMHVVCHCCRSRHAVRRCSRIFAIASTLCCPDTHQ